MPLSLPRGNAGGWVSRMNSFSQADKVGNFVADQGNRWLSGSLAKWGLKNKQAWNGRKD